MKKKATILNILNQKREKVMMMTCRKKTFVKRKKKNYEIEFQDNPILMEEIEKKKSSKSIRVSMTNS
jgi:hypothetical protein